MVAPCKMPKHQNTPSSPPEKNLKKPKSLDSFLAKAQIEKQYFEMKSVY